MSLFQVKTNVLLPLLQRLGRPQPVLTETVGGKKLILSSDDADNRLQYNSSKFGQKELSIRETVNIVCVLINLYTIESIFFTFTF